MTGARAFRPAWWLAGPHAQTVWASTVRRTPPPALRRERLELPDGDFLDLMWGGPERGPLVVVLHGLEGSVRSRYAAGLLAAVVARGWRGLLICFRGCGDEPNRLPRAYHSGDTGDLAHVLARLEAREPRVPRAAVGFSLGGNVLLKYLGEQPGTPLVAAAVAVSVPYDLRAAAWRLERGASRLYQWKLLRSLKAKVRAKAASLAGRIDVRRALAARSFREFDDTVTAPLHGFADAEDYYTRASSRPYLRHIATPTLLVHARDDPFMTPAAVPAPAELGPAVRLELYERGGHVGFVEGALPWRARYWLEPRILSFLAPHLETRD